MPLPAFARGVFLTDDPIKDIPFFPWPILAFLSAESFLQGWQYKFFPRGAWLFLLFRLVCLAKKKPGFG